MRSFAPPVVSVVALSLVLFSVVACEKRSAIPDAPPVASQPTAPAGSSPIPSHSTPATSPSPTTQPAKVAPPDKAAATSDEAALAAYNEKLAEIIYRRDKAENIWYMERRAADKRLMKEGPSVLLPIFDRYAGAVEKAAHEMRALPPPEAAKRVHQTITASFDRLGAILDTLVGVLHSDGGEDASELLAERKQAQAEDAEAIAKAVTESGFDIETFRRKARLVRKG